MKTFHDINIGDLFTEERKIKNNPHPTVWRKKSSRTAMLAHNDAVWFYFGAKEAVYTMDIYEVSE